ncbi:MAG: S-adenosylhomocysteine deaminase [Anaerolineaceae bacterium]|nr:S-adenosylhomocysteine deaminase [Anaerolineaceae bacterium]
MTATLLHNAMIVCLGDGDAIYDAGYIVIENDRIADIGDMKTVPDAASFDTVIDCTDRLIMPGLVNAHTHTPMTLFRGLAEGVSLLVLEGWLTAIRSLEAVMTPDMVPAAVEVACAEMIRTGTTTFADQYFFMDEIIPVVEKSGMRAALAYGIVELGDPVARERELANLEGFLEAIGSLESDRMQGWVGPHAFFVDNSEAMMQAERRIAAKYDTGLHIHISTTGEEDALTQELYGTSAVTQMERMGMLDAPILAAHAITIPEADWPTLAAHDFTAVAAASACMRAGAEAAPVLGMHQAGINVAIGTDNVCNNNDYDLFLEMRTLAKLTSFREKRPGALKAREILAMATANGAKALGLDAEIGSLEVGKRADLILLDRTDIGWTPLPTNDPFTALVYSVNGHAITDSMVNGRWLLRERQWTTLDYASAVQRQREDVVRLLALRDAAQA